MSLKSFDDFCARIVNNDPIQEKEIFDERQCIVRSRITIRALQAFAAMAGLNILIMECGPQWCESYVLSTAILAAAAYLYWVIANARRGSLFGVNGAGSAAVQASAFLVDGLLIPFVLFDNEEGDLLTNFFFRNGMVSEYLAAAIAGVLLIIGAAVMMSEVHRYNKAKKKDNDNS